MKKALKLVSAAALAGVLAACGGGGGDDPAAAPAPTPNPAPAPAPAADANTGSVDANFVAGATPRYVVLGITQRISDPRTAVPVVQDAAGVVTTLGLITLTGNPIATGSPKVTKEIAGDATYAQGRWVQGMVTTSPGTFFTLKGTAANEAVHYLAYNTLATFPTTTPAPLVCGAARVTAPTYVSGGAAGVSTATGTATGTATLSFSAAGADVSVTVNGSASGSTGSVTRSQILATPTAFAITGTILSSGGGGALMAVGDGAAGRYLVVAAYKVALANGASHQGVASYLCQ